MTLIVTTKRHSLAVLAAEQFYGGTSRLYWTKIVPHPDRAVPLAFAVGGDCAHLCIRGKDGAGIAHLLEFAKEITSADELDLLSIAQRLRGARWPRYGREKG